MRSIAIALGGAFGALLRFWLSTAVSALTGGVFPYGTLAVNVMGSGLMGLLYVLFYERMQGGTELRAALLIGVLGAFTTFSTFSIETMALLEEGERLKASLNILASVGLCLSVCWASIIVGRQL
jgi:CrcB protein